MSIHFTHTEAYPLEACNLTVEDLILTRFFRRRFVRRSRRLRLSRRHRSSLGLRLLSLLFGIPRVELDTTLPTTNRDVVVVDTLDEGLDPVANDLVGDPWRIFVSSDGDEGREELGGQRKASPQRDSLSPGEDVTGVQVKPHCSSSRRRRSERGDRRGRGGWA